MDGRPWALVLSLSSCFFPQFPYDVQHFLSTIFIIGSRTVPLLFALTMFVSATLLFLVQPMIGKMVLPLLGGTPAVWNTCMVFYQALLLLGYYYAHRTTAKLPVKKQTMLHAFVLFAAFAILMIAAILSADNSPIPVVKSLSPQGDNYPFFGVIVLLAVAIGLPFFVVSTSAPLLQKWFAETGHPSSKDPYFLYAASNFGSLLALVAYPSIVEPNLRLIHQAWLWAIGYGILVVMVTICARVVSRGPIPEEKPTIGKKKPVAVVADIEPEPTALRKLRWLALAFVPSSLMLGVTTFVSTDVVSLPLLWIIPLSLYLITFIIVFSKVPPGIHVTMSLLMPVMVLLIAFLMTSHVPAKFGLQVLLHMATFFVVTMVCHGELARDRPSPKHLTNFYLIMSIGGMLGGLFNAFFAPIFFTFTSEYPISLVLSCFLLPSLFVERKLKESKWTHSLDLLLPLGIFFLCRMFQENEGKLGEYFYLNGKYIIFASAIFAIPTAAAVFFLGKTVRHQVVLGIFLGTCLGLFGMVGPLMGHFLESTYSTIREFAGLLTTTQWRWLSVAVACGAYAFYWKTFGDKEEAPQYLVIGYGTLTLSFAMMLAFGEQAAENIGTDMARKANIGQLTVRQILVYGVPAMLCYFFVERPMRFGAAVGALWLASFVTEYKAGGDAFYDRSFFGRLKIDTVDRWKLLPEREIDNRIWPSLFPIDILDDKENYEITKITDSSDGEVNVYLTPRANNEKRPLYRARTVKIKKDDGETEKTFYYVRRDHTTLVHGTTTHGLQERDKERQDVCRALWTMSSTSALSAATYLEAGSGEAMQFPGRDPLTYYHRTGPVGSMFRAFDFRNRQKQSRGESINTNIGCIGLGTGSLSSYGAPGQKMTFFEIDTHVRNLVEPPLYFTYIDSAKKQGIEIDFVMGDARISLERQDRKYGFILVDAFSSDAIPAHLLTKQAMELYLQRLEPDGLVAVHISNRYLDLEPVVERLCRDMGLQCRIMHGESDPDTHDSQTTYWSNFCFASSWICIARAKEALGAVDEDSEAWEAEKAAAADGKAPYYHRWQPLKRKNSVGLWSDDYSPFIPILRKELRFWSSSDE